jgi:hypothetical protein
MNMTNFTPIQLRQAADLQEKIAQLQSDLAAILGREVEATPVAKPVKKKGGMSAAGRARIAAAQKARWAKAKTGNAPVASQPAKKKTHKMSAEGLARIKAAQKARWAKIKADKDTKKA